MTETETVKVAKEIKMAAVAVTAIVGLVLIELEALRMGINGAMLGATVAAIAGLGGFAAGKIKPREA